MSGMTHADIVEMPGKERRKGVRLLTKAEACRELGVSLSTLDRRIATGELETRRKPRGRRHRVYVVMEGEPPEDRDDFASVQFALAQEKIRGLQEQVAFLGEHLRVEQERNSQLFEQLKTVVVRTSPRNRRRRWWRFWDPRK